MTTATPDTTLTKYDDVEVGHWVRTPDGQAVEVVGLEWNQASGGVIVHTRAQDAPAVAMAPYGLWRETVHPCLPPWAE